MPVVLVVLLEPQQVGHLEAQHRLLNRLGRHRRGILGTSRKTSWRYRQGRGKGVAVGRGPPAGLLEQETAQVVAEAAEAAEPVVASSIWPRGQSRAERI